MINRQMLRTWVIGLVAWCGVFISHTNGQPIRKDFFPVDSFEHYQVVLATRYKTGVSAHRGDSQLAPENTLATFREALTMRVAYIEIDVRTTKDGQLIILHDASLNRTTTGFGPLKDQTLAALKNLSAGKGFNDRFQAEPIPTLDDVCQLVSRWNAGHSTQTNLYIDCKDVAPQPLVATLKTYGLLENAVFYGSDGMLLALKNVAPTARLMPSLAKTEEMPDKIRKLNPYAFDVSWSEVNEMLVRQIHQRGIKVFSDLLDSNDSVSQYRKAARLKIDIIQTDYVLSVYRTLAGNRD